MKKIKRTLSILLTVAVLFTSAALFAPPAYAAGANETAIYNFLTQVMGMNVAAACGVLANIERESSFNPSDLGDQGTSYGICQWHNSRWDRLKEYCNENGYDWTTLIGQLYFLSYELQKFYPSVYKYLMGVENSAEGAYDAAYYWCYYFEIPANREKAAQTRGENARDRFWGNYGNGASGSVASPDQTGYYIVNADPALRIRSAASATASVVGNVPLNTKINVSAISGNWGKVTYENVTGWVNLEYATYTGTGANAATISVDKTSVSMGLFSTNTATVKVTCSGSYGTIFYSSNSAKFSVTRYAWSGNVCTFTVAARAAGTAELTFRLLDAIGNTLTQTQTSITVAGPTLTAAASSLSVDLSEGTTASTTLTAGGNLPAAYKAVCNAPTDICTAAITEFKNNSAVLTVTGKRSGTANITVNLMTEDGSLMATKMIAVSVTGSDDVYEITYDANGGSGAPEGQSKDYGKPVVLSDLVPKKEGYSFLGWATKSAATEPEYAPGDEYSANADLTLYAVWKLHPPEARAISVNKAPDKTVFYVGEAFTDEGMEIKLIYSDGSFDLITEGFTVEGFDTSSAGEHSATVKYGDFVTNYTYEVKGLSVIPAAEKYAMTVGDKVQLQYATEPAGKIATWQSGDPATAAVDRDGFVTAIKAGSADITATVRFKGVDYTAVIPVNVYKKISSVSVAHQPDKLTYYTGDVFDVTGLELLIKHPDGSSETVKDGFSVPDVTFSEEGERTVEVAFCGNSVRVTVNVKKSEVPPEISAYDSLVSVVSATGAVKMIFAPGEYTEAADLAAAKNAVTLNGTDIAAATKDGKFTRDVSGYGKYTFLIEYESGHGYLLGVETTRAMISLSVESAPEVTEYYVGQPLNTKGLQIRAFYYNGSSEPVTEGFEISGYEPNVPGYQTVTVSYENMAVTFEVLVRWEEDPPELTVNDRTVTVINADKATGVLYAAGDYSDANELKASSKKTSLDKKYLSEHAAGGAVAVEMPSYGVYSFLVIFESGNEYLLRCNCRVAGPFIDVPDDSWYTAAVGYCYQKGLMSGISATEFAPTSLFDRAMFVTVLARIAGADTSKYTESSFADVKTGKWYTGAIEWAYKNGFAAGVGADSSGKPLFGFDSPVSREQLAQFIYNYTERKGGNVSAKADLSAYSDAAKISEWAKTAVSWAVASGLISGTSASTVSPRSTATRAQVALIIMNYVEKIAK